MMQVNPNTLLLRRLLVKQKQNHSLNSKAYLRVVQDYGDNLLATTVYHSAWSERRTRYCIHITQFTHWGKYYNHSWVRDWQDNDLWTQRTFGQRINWNAIVNYYTSLRITLQTYVLNSTDCHHGVGYESTRRPFMVLSLASTPVPMRENIPIPVETYPTGEVVGSVYVCHLTLSARHQISRKQCRVDFSQLY